MPRPLSELEVRATAHTHKGVPISAIVGDEFLHDVVEGKISPSKAFNLGYAKTKCQGCAKAIRWLAVISRDYGQNAAQ